MWHRRWIGLAAAWIVAIVAVTVALRIPDRYEASARVYVDTQTLLRPLMEGLSIQPNLDQQVVLLSRTLISRPNVEKVVRMADLDLSTSSPAARDELVDSVVKGLKLGGGGTTNHLHDHLSRRQPGAGAQGRAVAADDLRRVEPGRQAAGHACRGTLRRRADQAVRRVPEGGRESPEGIPAQVPGRGRPGRARLFRPTCKAWRRHRRLRSASCAPPSNRATRTSASWRARPPCCCRKDPTCRTMVRGARDRRPPRDAPGGTRQPQSALHGRASGRGRDQAEHRGPRRAAAARKWRRCAVQPRRRSGPATLETIATRCSSSSRCRWPRPRRTSLRCAPSSRRTRRSMRSSGARRASSRRWKPSSRS